MADPAAYLTTRDVADRLGLAKTDSVLAWIAAGTLPAVNVSSGPGRPTSRIASAELDTFLAGRRAVPTHPPHPPAEAG